MSLCAFQIVFPSLTPPSLGVDLGLPDAPNLPLPKAVLTYNGPVIPPVPVSTSMPIPPPTVELGPPSPPKLPVPKGTQTQLGLVVPPIPKGTLVPVPGIPGFDVQLTSPAVPSMKCPLDRPRDA